jgi:hypothetical protein
VHGVGSLAAKRPLAVHKRTQTGAAGVSPPWLRNRACADAFVIALKIADSVCGSPLHSRLW